ncbi:kinase-like protein [Hortaea werneckii]|nr:kinase-like protein [Hortaea werneckii]KAI7308642.1 kinase-like protein [Hortaea werneckii]
MAEEEDQKYEVLQKIGQGSFGIIRKVRRREDNQLLCRKEISYARMSDREKQQLASELDILRNLRHPNIVQYYSREHLKGSQDVYLYMEYCGNGDLGGYIKKLNTENRWADEEFVWQIFAQLVGALYRCHYGEDPPKPGEEGMIRKGKALQTKAGHRVILHRDLKPENVFLGQNNAVKLGDFGLSKIIQQNDMTCTYVGTPYYMSPEICANERYSHHADIWSLGCIMYELAARVVPFDARSQIDLYRRIKAGVIKPLPDMYSKELSDVISWCLNVNPMRRPDTTQLLNGSRIKASRARLETTLQLERAQQDRDAAMSRLNSALKQIGDLQREVERLREAGEKSKMEWHAKATLAIDQRIAEAEKRSAAQLEQYKAEYEAHLRAQFDAAVEQQVDEKLKLHQASLPHSHGLGKEADVQAHVRSNTPPPGAEGKNTASFATTGTTTADSDGSSVAAEGGLESTLASELSSVSILDPPEEEEVNDDASPLAARTKPLPTKSAQRMPRQPFGRAKTLANYPFEQNGTDSPRDIHMADPSPMPSHVGPPMSLQGLSLSPRRNGRAQDRLSGAGMRKNIFNLAAEQKLRPSVPGERSSGFADDILEDDDEGFPESESPSRPASGASNHALPSMTTGGDPFKALGAPPKRSRPSLGRQQTMPVNMPAHNSRPRTHLPANVFNPRPSSGSSGSGKNLTASPEREKENNPPTSSRSNVPIASPRRNHPPTTRDGKVLTPSRKAPAPPSSASNAGLPKSATAGNLTRLAAAANHNPSSQGFQSPSKVKGRTLLELAQGRTAAATAASNDVEAEGRGLLGSPMKWDPVEHGEDMPSPFLAKKGRAVR